MDLLMETSSQGAKETSRGHLDLLKRKELRNLLPIHPGIWNIAMMKRPYAKAHRHYPRNRCASINNQFINLKKNVLCFTM